MSSNSLYVIHNTHHVGSWKLSVGSMLFQYVNLLLGYGVGIQHEADTTSIYKSDVVYIAPTSE
jgi:hypothetical protein